MSLFSNKKTVECIVACVNGGFLSTFLHQSRFRDCAFEVEEVFFFILIFSTIVLFFRLYALRRIRDGFRAGKSLTDSTKISEALQKAEENVEVIKRQVRWNVMF
jgi:hypothetical protein